MPYELFTHRHNFAVWAAARAAQRGFAGVATLRGALEASAVQRFLPDPQFVDIDYTRFEELHRSWCSSICDYLNNRPVANVTYGRSAKLLAIYLKSMIIVGGSAYTSLGRCIHPPIDRRLLQALAGDPSFDPQHRALWRHTNWTQLTEEDYYNLIGQLRTALPKEIPFWMLEEHWTAADEDE